MNPTATLNNSLKIPYLGFGTWKLSSGKETYDAVRYALDVGYRHIDTAQFYGNEADVGKAVHESNISREEIFVVSKVAISNFGYEQTIKSVEESLNKAKLDYFDLFLLHFPVQQLRIESYKALEKLHSEGKLRSIGVSNFTIEHLEELVDETGIIPAVNQVEFSPYLNQKELHEYCKEKGIQLEAYSPLTQGVKLNDPKLTKIAEKYNKSTAQILIKWCLQHEIVVIPKSSNPERIKQNFQMFDFEILQEDMNALDGFNENFRNSWNPEDKKQLSTFSNGVIRKLSKLKTRML
ncbi:aldo/keto reductase [Candidatus Dojkabacteria bacterium]|uniref:Aldo/keto reductase n=1 Tax=Candidatus Dojkabacteria bacterium TaxID=2099670 RepID=A0A955L8P1_9BACT|nr:aldo/keto reductase [Candidatus Dojkabacteria bacterium]